MDSLASQIWFLFALLGGVLLIVHVAGQRGRRRRRHVALVMLALMLALILAGGAWTSRSRVRAVRRSEVARRELEELAAAAREVVAAHAAARSPRPPPPAPLAVEVDGMTDAMNVDGGVRVENGRIIVSAAPRSAWSSAPSTSAPAARVEVRRLGGLRADVQREVAESLAVYLNELARARGAVSADLAQAREALRALSQRERNRLAEQLASEAAQRDLRLRDSARSPGFADEFGSWPRDFEVTLTPARIAALARRMQPVPRTGYSGLGTVAGVAALCLSTVLLKRLAHRNAGGA
ncbi:MAG: hypothetical protein AB1716_02670 [Planctomycetota bacterium]